MSGAGDDETLAADDLQSVTGGSLFAGRYVIEAELGRGGMGTVHAAFDRTLGERVALKVLHDVSATKHDAALERFLREVRLARRVTHRNVARTHDVGDVDGQHYLTMELVEGQALDEMLREGGPLSPTRVVAFGRQVAEGLDAAHAVGVVHRDLKPSNILVDAQGRIVLTDFGIARALEDDRRITQDGAGLLGTPAYMAPEQVRGGDVGAPADVFALGLVLYELLTGRLPYAASTAVGLAIARLEGEPAPLPAAVPGLLGEVVMSCLAQDPGARPPASSLAEQLVALAQRVGDDWSVAGPSLAATSTSSRRTAFHTVSAGEHGLAVLPFAFRGSSDDAYLAAALTEELIDLLSMTQGLRVPSSAATLPFAEERSPSRVGAALDVRSMVDGTVQKAGERVRISVRLIDVASGVQTWTERFDGRLEDVFDLQDRMAKRIAETLRLELETRGFDDVSPEAVELCLRAREKRGELGSGGSGPDGAVALYERCLELAPDFPPALAGYAFTIVKVWFFPGRWNDRDWASLAKVAVDDALARAPGLVDTHLASARYHVQLGAYDVAAAELVRVLRIAPTCVGAHDYLAALQCEAGRVEEGMRRAELVTELDPTQVGARMAVAHVEALRGNHDEAQRLLDQVARTRPDFLFPVMIARIRVSIWRGDEDARRTLFAALHGMPGSRSQMATQFSSLFEGPQGVRDAEQRYLAMIEHGSPRLTSLVSQLLAEGAAALGHEDLAMRMFTRAVDAGLVDLEWVDRCPALDPLRDEPRFPVHRRRVAERAEAIWSIA